MVGYAGDVSPQEAWEKLSSDKAAVLVDVRTKPEWGFVGIPDLSSLGKESRLISWQVYPEMAVSGSFTDEVEALGLSHDTPIYFLCRTGVRSKAAAIAMTAKGFKACYNISCGFEGDINEVRHRGRLNGWKAVELPWVQQ
jgi:rhodanese-related sulfurtransferase